VGDEIEFVVLELDKENRRMSLGHKQLEENPWEVFETIFAVGSKHSGTVVKLDGNQAVVALPYGLEGSCHVKHLNKADGNAVAVEEAAEFVVLEFNRNAKRITVSHTRTFEEAPQAAEPSKERKQRAGGGSNRMMNEVNASVERSTFGDLDVLSALKEQMDGSPEDVAAEKQPAPKKKADKSTETEAAAEVTEAAAENTAEEPVTEEKPKAKKAPAKKAAAKKPAAKKTTAKAKKDAPSEGEEDSSEA